MSGLSGTAALVRIIVRRDRSLIAAWVLLLAGYPVLEVANASPGYQGLARSPGFLMLYGPLYGTDVGAIATWSSGDVLWVYGLVSLLMVIRHTRTEEESGRGDLVVGAVVGRQAGLSAALIVVLGANLLLATVAAGGVMTQGLTADGSIALGLRFAAVGWVFAAVAAVVAQLAQTAAAARGIAIAALGGAFLLRAAGDAAGSDDGTGWLSWVSPLGWAHRLRPFADERWWILGLVVVTVVVLIGAAAALSARRDVGAGVLRPRPGPATGPPRLATPLALAWRLHRGALLAWAAGFSVIGGVFGGAADGAADLFGGDQRVEELFRRIGGNAQANDVFLASILGILGLIAAGYAVQATLRLRSEEEARHAEPLLATPVGRMRWAGSHLAFAVAGPAAVLAAGGLTAGLAYGKSTGDVGHQVPRVVAGAVVQLPAVWVLGAFSLALFGLLPRYASGGWVAWAAMIVVWALGAFGQLGESVQNASPFTKLPKLPGEDVALTPLVWLVAISTALTAAGLVGLRRRDVGPG